MSLQHWSVREQQNKSSAQTRRSWTTYFDHCVKYELARPTRVKSSRPLIPVEIRRRDWSARPHDVLLISLCAITLEPPASAALNHEINYDATTTVLGGF
ncbi:hypothetical protein FRC08_014425 [Ceratobasidium sp. 394]|nr:hypothetical protein FRC08_014425 [Ceratobasidium sp. 394]